jgi:hypothetical protein
MIGSTDLYRRLETVARTPVTAGNIPTHFAVILRLQRTIEDPDSTHKDMARVLFSEPMVVTRLVQAANTAAFIHHPPVMDLESAIFRLGSASTRRIALGVMMSQLTQSKPLLRFSSVSRHIWLHSLYTSAASAVLCEEYGIARKDEALFAGLVLNIGAFHLLYLISKDQELSCYQDEIKEWLVRHLLKTTQSVLQTMAMPKTVCQAVAIELIESRIPVEEPNTLQDVLLMSFLLASERCPWSEEGVLSEYIDDDYLALWPQIEEQFSEVQTAFTAHS